MIVAAGASYSGFDDWIIAFDGRFHDFANTDGYREPTTDFIDGNLYDGKKPLEYISSFDIGLKDES